MSKPSSCVELLSQMPPQIGTSSGKLVFQGIDDRDIYNICAPFVFKGERLIAGRVEHRNCECAEIVFFREEEKGWKPHPEAPILRALQDPCVTLDGDTLIVGGVKYPIPMADGTMGWKMEFWKGTSLSNFNRFLIGPEKMKDIRLKPLSDGRVAIMSRPQGGVAGMGKIGFTIAEDWNTVTPQLIADAPVYEHLFRKDEWGGANELHLLENGQLGVLGHIAYLTTGDVRHYHAMVFMIELETGKATTPRIIARRMDFPEGPSKRPDLVDVIFSGGLVRHADGRATLYAGLSDAEAGWLNMVDPFVAFETNVSAS